MADSQAYDPASSAKLDAVTFVGQPLDRLDGVAKVTGQAKYATSIIRARAPRMASLLKPLSPEAAFSGSTPHLPSVRRASVWS
jgi:hypothetical protein